MKPQRVVVALSGGGAKAAAHVGAIKALEDWNIKPAHYVGTSMGAVVGACFAAGLKYEEVLRRMLSITRKDVAGFSPRALLGPWAKNLLRSRPLADTIAQLVPARRFLELKTSLTVTAVDLKTSELVLFGAGGISVGLIEALYASCALPLYYPPAVIGGREYVDGGLRAVLPIDVAAEFEPDVVVGVSVGPSLYERPAENAPRTPPLIQAHSDTTRVMMAAQTQEMLERWKSSTTPLVFVQPVIEADATFAVDNVARYVELGYRATHRALVKWKEGSNAA